ncbi:MAG: hypothetical protein WD156_08400 [Acidimicrobiia bacterium]
MRVRGSTVALMAFISACSPTATEPAPDAEYVHVAEGVCSTMWDWQLDMGAIMNAMSAASRAESDSGARLSLYRQSFSEARVRMEDLEEAIVGLPQGPFVDRIREDIRNGLFAAEGIITEIDTEVDSLHHAGTNGYREVVPHIFLGFEKVIDVAKPEMADYGDPELLRAFISVPQCQHGVKDANDGQPRFVPRS